MKCVHLSIKVYSKNGSLLVILPHKPYSQKAEESCAATLFCFLAEAEHFGCVLQIPSGIFQRIM
jgi:hypothetical protein